MEENVRAGTEGEKDGVPFDDGEDLSNSEVRSPVLLELRDADCSICNVHIRVEDFGGKVACMGVRTRFNRGREGRT